MFAIVDIETTGGHAYDNGITEIAIILHNGREVEGKFCTLINPGIPIPRYIVSLTGITDEMVREAPKFEDVASNIFNLLQNRIFVAHNVNFDYSFVKHHLSEAGYNLNVRKLCTVRLARKAFPGFPRYGLGHLCRSLEIEIDNRHRAFGDAAATAVVFEKIMQSGADHVRSMLKGKKTEQYLPPNLSTMDILNLPPSPGVYYFHDDKNRIIYVGKATHLQRRVKSHFSNNDGSRRKQELLRRVHRISHKVCSSELAALILESNEIRRIWPEFNRSQKRYHHMYGLYQFEDQKGYHRLVIEKKLKQLTPVYTFNLLHEGQVLLRKLVEEFGLHERFCFPQTDGNITLPDDPPALYNSKVARALQRLNEQLPTFAVRDAIHDSPTYFLLVNGRYYGMSNAITGIDVLPLETLKEKFTPEGDNDYIRGLLYQFVQKYPDRKLPVTVSA
jgi:DNA polymerase III subunit epsilon